MDTVLQALADPSRRIIVEVRRDHPAAAGERAEALPIARPGSSRHLRVLRDAGLVDVRKDAQRRIYRLRAEPLAQLDAWLSPYRAHCSNQLHSLERHLQTTNPPDPRDPPCPRPLADPPSTPTAPSNAP